MYARQDEKCWPGTERLGMDRGVTRRSITNHLAELKGVGLITTERRPGTSQVYWIMPMWTVYGQEDKHHRFTEEALKVCNLDENGRIPRNQDVKVSKVVDAPPPVPMGDVATGLAEAGKRTEERRVARGKKMTARQAAKPKNPKALPKDPDKVTPFKLAMKWEGFYGRQWPELPKPLWAAPEMGLAKKLLAAYEDDLVLKVCEMVITHWEDYMRRWSLEGQPSIRLVWGYRETLFAEAVTGASPGGSKSEAMRADEFDADGDALEKSGW